MKYCKNCFQPDTRPNTYFTPDGICPACDYYEKMTAVDWDERYEILQNVISQHPRKPGQYFDCIIGVSGGKDSTRQAIWARDKLGLRPLLVCFSYPPQQITERGAYNLSNLIELGFDTLVISPQPETWRKTLKEGFLNFTNWAKASEQAIIGSAPKIAIKYNIPLILWGENPGLQLGDMKTLGRTGYDGNNLRHMNTVSSGSLDWLHKKGLKSQDLICFQYPSVEEFDRAKLQIVYLGWFWKDWSIINNGMYSVTQGLDVREDTVENTGDLTNVFSLDEDWVTLNQMIKYYKYGFGRATDHVNEAVRAGLMTREEGQKKIERYDGCCSDFYISTFCKYIDISIDEFWYTVYSSVNQKLFEVKNDGTILPKFKVGLGL